MRLRNNFTFCEIVLLFILLLQEIHFARLTLSSESKAIVMADSELLYTCDFEVFGKVQGVFFRKYTAKEARKLGLHGWCMNTVEGTVKGQLEGPLTKLNEMKNWLRTKGSPHSRIDKAVITEAQAINESKFTNFVIRQ